MASCQCTSELFSKQMERLYTEVSSLKSITETNILQEIANTLENVHLYLVILKIVSKSNLQLITASEYVFLSEIS